VQKNLLKQCLNRKKKENTKMVLIEHTESTETEKFKRNEKNELFTAVKPPRKIYKKEGT